MTGQYDHYAETLIQELSKDPTQLSSGMAKRLAFLLNGITGVLGNTPPESTPSAATGNAFTILEDVDSAQTACDLMKGCIRFASESLKASTHIRIFFPGGEMATIITPNTTKTDSGVSAFDWLREHPEFGNYLFPGEQVGP